MKENRHIISILAGLLSLFMVLGMVGRIQPDSAKAASSSEIQNQLDELEEENEALEAEIKSLRAQLSENLGELKKMVTQKDLLDQEIALMYQQILNMNTQISAYRLLIADKQDELDQAEQRLKDMQVKNKARIRAMEENGELSYWAVLFESNSFAEMLDRLEMVQEIAAADIKCLEEMDAAAKEVTAARDALYAEQLQLEEKLSEMEALQVQLEEKRAQIDQLLIELKAKGEEYEAMIMESEQMQEDLAAEIALKTDELEDAKYREWLATYKPTGGTGGTGNNVGGVTWLLPCSYTAFTSPFGNRYHPISGQWKMHNGVDLAGREGTPIMATRAGYVTTASYQHGGAGWYVALSHGDGYGSIYMHMTHYIVKPGQYVEAGQVIGYMGNSGGSTGVHLHFGISYNGVYVNPADYIYIR